MATDQVRASLRSSVSERTFQTSSRQSFDWGDPALYKAVHEGELQMMESRKELQRFKVLANEADTKREQSLSLQREAVLSRNRMSKMKRKMSENRVLIIEEERKKESEQKQKDRLMLRQKLNEISKSQVKVLRKVADAQYDNTIVEQEEVKVQKTPTKKHKNVKHENFIVKRHMNQKSREIRSAGATASYLPVLPSLNRSIGIMTSHRKKDNEMERNFEKFTLKLLQKRKQKIVMQSTCRKNKSIFSGIAERLVTKETFSEDEEKEVKETKEMAQKAEEQDEDKYEFDVANSHNELNDLEKSIESQLNFEHNPKGIEKDHSQIIQQRQPVPLRWEAMASTVDSKIMYPKKYVHMKWNYADIK